MEITETINRKDRRGAESAEPAAMPVAAVGRHAAQSAAPGIALAIFAPWRSLR
jgi:hypothetical protein